MSDYIDLVICTHDGCDYPFLFQAPAWSELKKGDSVIVDTKRGEQPATVERKYTTENTGAELDFILTASGATTPLRKVLKKVEYKEFKYEED